MYRDALVPQAGTLQPTIGARSQTSPLPEAAALLFPMGSPLPPAKRLVVLVPDANVDEARLAERIWSLASPRELEVLYLGTLRQAQELYRAHRRLVMLAAVTTDAYVRVEIGLADSSSWVAAVRSVWRPGDLIICHDELTVTRGLRQQPAAQALLASLHAPVYVLHGFYPNLPKEDRRRLARMAGWLPSLAIILVFFAMQAAVSQATIGVARTILLVASLIAEFGLIAAWEHFLGNV